MDRSVFASLIILPPLYAAVLLLSMFPADSVGVWVGAAITIAIGVISVSTNKVIQEIAALLLIVLAFLSVAGLAGGGVFAGFGLGVADGALIGLPFVVSAYVWRRSEPILNRIAAFQVTLLLVLMLLATRAAFVSANSPVTAVSFISEFVSVNVQQLLSLGALVQGLTYPGLPLSQVSDPIFLATSVLAFAGLLLVLVRPQTGRETELPTTPFVSTETYRTPDPAVRPLSWSQRELLDRRSRPSGPPDRWQPGVGPLLGAGVATGAGLALAFSAPNAFLLSTALVVVAFLCLLGWVLSGPRTVASPTLLDASEAVATGDSRGMPPPSADTLEFGR